jgi:glycine cleavage system H lipoate-binding protein
MGALIEMVQAVGVFLAGLAVRVGMVVLFAAALLLPVALALAAVRAFRHARSAAAGLRRVGGVLYKPGARYAAGHTWIEREGDRLKVGLDGVAQEILPWALAVELPRQGALLREGDVAVVVSCGGVEARIGAPVAGKVVAVNAELARDPSLVKEDGYGRGWLFAVEPVDARWATLPAGDVAREWIEKESDRLRRFLESRLGIGGLASRSSCAPMRLAAPDWDDLTRSFLHA